MTTDEDTDLATCRLRTGLVEDCLLRILGLLNAVDLIQMSRVHDYFKDLIVNRIIGTKLLNLSELSQASKNEILETFGKSMTKFAIDEMNLNNFLDTVMKYCSPASLAEVDLNLRKTVTVDYKIEQSMSFFTNLQKLKLNVHCKGEHSFDDFLKRVLEAATNLHTLQLYRVDIGIKFFKINQLKNLRDLQLIKPFFLCSATLTGLIRNSPNLETFLFEGFQDVMSIRREIGITLATCCPKLKNFADIHLFIPDNHHTVGLERYTFLSSLSELNYITLTSYTFCGSDLFHPLAALASKNIQKLRIFSYLHNAVAYSGADRERIMQTSIAEFRSLRELHLNVQYFKPTNSVQFSFIMQFATKLTNLDTFSLRSGTLANADQIIELLPKINKLSISEISFKHLPVEMRKIVDALRTIRQAVEPNDKRKLKLLVNNQQWRELQACKDVNNLMEIILDPVLEPYNYERIRRFL